MTTRSKWRLPTACACARCARWCRAFVPRASRSRKRPARARAERAFSGKWPAPDLIRGERRFSAENATTKYARTGTVRINALHFQVEGSLDPAHGIHLLPVRGAEFLSRKRGAA